MGDTEKEYEKLAKKYKLPDFKDIDADFEISDVENHDLLLKGILRKIGEKLEFYNGILSEVLQPDASSLSAMHETRFFNDAEKGSMYSLFKDMMGHYREIIMLMLKNDEKEQALFLGRFFAEWQGIKKQLADIIGKMKDSWESEITREEELGYFG